jgi:N-acetylglucosamine-6-sulfatase
VFLIDSIMPRLPKKSAISTLALFGLFAASALVAAQSDKPNILIIFSDDHALRTISAYAGEDAVNQTPNIDRLAEEGAIFTRSFCGNSICQPSRAAILTGKHSHKNGVMTNGSAWDPNQQIFTRLLGDAGYQTAMIGKWHMHPFPSDEFDYHKTLTGMGGQGRYYNPEFVTFEGETVIEAGYSTDIITTESIEWMEGRDPSKPFVMMCQFKSPHTNVMPPLRNLDMFNGKDIPVPESYHSDRSGRSKYLGHTWMQMSGMAAKDVLKTGPSAGSYDLPAGELNADRAKELGLPGFYSYMTPEQLAEWHAHYDPINEEYARRLAEGQVSKQERLEFPYQRYMKDYLRCVAAIDQNVGRLLEYLDASGLSENTIVIYSSDQGFFLGENGFTDKRLADDVTMSMPFLIRWPGVVAPGQRIDAMIQNIDYAPTFLDVAGVAVPADMDGESLLPILSGVTSDDWRESVYYHYYHNEAYNLPKIEAVRSDRYKLVRYYDHQTLKFGEDWELFDLEKDPAEQQSVYTNPEYAAVLQKMKRELNELRDQYDVVD